MEIKIWEELEDYDRVVFWCSIHNNFNGNLVSFSCNKKDELIKKIAQSVDNNFAE